ncbi:MAG: minichromosome maintenance protein MCM [Halobacteriaceae archaeon]
MSDAAGGGYGTDGLVDFLRTYYTEAIADLALHYPHEQRSLTIAFDDLFQYDPGFAEALREEPAAKLAELEDALAEYDLAADVDLSHAHVRVAGLDDTYKYSVGGYRSRHIGQYLAVSGQVSNVTQVKTEIREAAWECKRCGAFTRVPSADGAPQEPVECEACERKGPFQLHEGRSDMVDFQAVRLRQPPEETRGGGGATLDVHLRDDLAQPINAAAGLAPGDRATLTGELQLDNPADADGAVDKRLRGRAVELEETDFEAIEIDEEDREAAEALAAGEHGDPYDLLVESIAPELYGMDDVKLAAALQMFGGNGGELASGARTRGDSHILLLGDPGSGKSSLLKYMEAIAPRATYSSAKGASAAGLTAAAVADEFGGGKWMLEPGAMVVANGGIACLDELDKMQEDAVESLHEALEDQRVSINKAGINTQLPAKTAVLAAGNPKYGRFDPNEPYAEQIDLDPALISRFDLIFMLDDQPDQDHDREVAEHMIETRIAAVAEDEADTQASPALVSDLVRSWAALAKQEVQPRITDEAVKEHLTEYYVSLREEGAGADSAIPLTARNLEAILRLAEASARVRLSDEVTMGDAERAISLVERSMRDVGVDEDGNLDADIIETGSSKAMDDRRKTLRAYIDEIDREDSEAGGAHVNDVLDRMVEGGYDRDTIEHDIKHLKQQGEIYEMGADRIRTT